jgi:hypothetical protein
MKVDNIKNFKAGWIAGNFEPSLVKTKDFEIAMHHHEKGYIPEKHYQKTATEYNLIVEGGMVANGETLSTGDIFIYEPFEVCDIVFTEDTTIVVFKVPSVGPNDKVVVE